MNLQAIKKENFVAAAKSLYSNDLGKAILSDTQPNNKEGLFFINSLSEYLEYEKKMMPFFNKRLRLEEKMAKMFNGPFELYGVDPLSGKESTFFVGRHRKRVRNGIKIPNYRESLVSKVNKLNSRLRATALLINQICTGKRNLSVYFTEQVTPFFDAYKFNPKFKELVASEFLGPDMESGTVKNGLLHQDMTRLSFKNESFDLLVTLEVLEHIPDYKKAVKEIFRVMKPGGSVIITVPFLIKQQDTRIRATLNSKGEIEHILPPEYHGDPVNPEGGILCFQHFGWDLIDELKQSGFSEVRMACAWSLKHGIIGGREINMIHATKK